MNTNNNINKKRTNNKIDKKSNKKFKKQKSNKKFKKQKSNKKFKKQKSNNKIDKKNTNTKIDKKRTNKNISIKNKLGVVHPLKLYSKDELIEQYKASNKYYSHCLLKEFKYNKLYQQEYQDIYSNKQIKTLWKLSKKNRSIGHRLLNMLTKRMNIRSYNFVINILNNLDTDVDIYNELRKVYLIDNKKCSNKEKKLCTKKNLKTSLYYDKIKNYIPKFEKEFNFNLTNYLDIGCGDCIVTEKLGKLLGLEPKNIYGADFNEFSEQQYKINNNINFTILQKNYKKLPYDDNSISLISLMNVLHHVDNLDILLSEIKRILKPSGILMIIEPDVIDYVDYMLLDVEHLLYHFVYDNNRKDNLHIKDLKDIKANYINWLSLDMILKEYNLNFVVANYLSRSFKYEMNYNREFWAFYSISK